MAIQKFRAEPSASKRTEELSGSHVQIVESAAVKAKSVRDLVLNGRVNCHTQELGRATLECSRLNRLNPGRRFQWIINGVAFG